MRVHEKVPTTSLKPVLFGGLRERTIRVIGEVAGELREQWTGPSSRMPHSSLVGHALFFLHLARVVSDRELLLHARRLVGAAVEALEQMPMKLSLHGGAAGICWLLAHFERLDPGGPLYDMEALDRLIGRSIETLEPAERDFDLICGLVGLGVYLRERPATTYVRKTESDLFRCLTVLADRKNGSIWFNYPSLLYPDARLRFQEGRYDFGIAHGIPGVIAYLSILLRTNRAESGQTAEVVRRLSDVTKYMFNQRWRNPNCPAFAPFQATLTRSEGHGEEAPSFASSRVAWCYGDVGTGMALHLSAGTLKRKDWAREARRILLRSFSRPFEQSGVRDASLCHGAAGIAHCAQVMHSREPSKGFDGLARRWVSLTLAQRTEAGIAGFNFALDASTAEVQRSWNGTFLCGTPGIGLALIHAAFGGERSWDRLLLAS